MIQHKKNFILIYIFVSIFSLIFGMNDYVLCREECGKMTIELCFYGEACASDFDGNEIESIAISTSKENNCVDECDDCMDHYISKNNHLNFTKVRISQNKQFIQNLSFNLNFNVSPVLKHQSISTSGTNTLQNIQSVVLII